MSTNWSNAPSSGGFPGNGNGGIATYDAVIGAGAATLNQNVTIEKLTLTGGTLNGTGILSLNSNLVWSGSVTLLGTGAIAVAGSNSSITGSGILARSLTNTGTMTYSSVDGANGIFFGYTSGENGVLNNSGTFNTTAGGDFKLYPGANSANQAINNSGTWNVSGAGTISDIAVPFNNSGTVNVQSGILQLSKPSGDASSSGSFNVSAGATLDFVAGSPGTTTLQPGSGILGAGSVDFSSGLTIINGAYNVTGGTRFRGGTVTFNTSPTNFGTLSVSAGAVTFNSTTPLGSLDHSGGTIDGAGAIAVGGNLVWTNSFSLRGSGTTSVAGSNSSISGSGILARSLTNTGTMTYSSADGSNGILFGYISGENGILNNSGTFNITAGGDLKLYPGANSANQAINNSGTWNVSGAGTISDIAVPFNNSGTVNVQSGILQLSKPSGDASSSGSFNVSAGATLDFVAGSPGTTTLQPGSGILGAGSVDFSSGLTIINGAYNVTGGTRFRGGTVTFNTSPTNFGTLSVSAGAVTFNSTTPLGSLDHSGGTIDGAGAIAVGGNLVWTNSFSLRGSGTTTVAGSNSSITGSGILARSLTNTGTMTYSSEDSASGILFGYSGGENGVLNNSGTFNITAGGDLKLYPGANSANQAINNSGTWNVSGTGMLSDIAVPFNNSGTVNIQSGSLAFTGNYKQTAGVLALLGGSISGSTALAIQGGQIVGSGTVNAAVNNTAGTISPGVSSAGALNISGNLTLGNDSVLFMEIGGKTQGTQYDFLSEAGSTALSLDGKLQLALINGFQGSILATDVFTIVSSNQAILGAFDNVLNGGRIFTADGLGSFQVNYGAGSAFGAENIVLSHFVVPEPSSAAMLLFAGSLALSRRTRRSRK